MKPKFSSCRKMSRTVLKKIVPWIFIIFGVFLIGMALFQRFETSWHQRELVQQYEKYSQKLKDGSAEPSEPVQEAKNEASDLSKSRMPLLLQNPDEQKAKKDEEKKIPEIIGILQIPKIDLKVAIGEGADYDSMRYTVGHFPNTARPGAVGNFSLIGHRSYRYGQFFNRLDELEKGDSFTVKSGTKTFTYRITEKMVVNPEDVWVLDSTNDASITLITCTPIRIATHRLIVKGVLENKNK